MTAYLHGTDVLGAVVRSPAKGVPYRDPYDALREVVNAAREGKQSASVALAMKPEDAENWKAYALTMFALIEQVADQGLKGQKGEARRLGKATSLRVLGEQVVDEVLGGGDR